MEFPDLGKNCHESTCKQLDFLPMKCDACSNIFCKDHIKYDTHKCPESYKKDNQVPVCPLCNEAISVKKGDLPDVVVSRHIDNDCSSDLAKQRRKIYTNKCSLKGCKQKELVPVLCDRCHKNYCFRHRHETDHDCKGFDNTGRGISHSGFAAIFRNKASASSSSNSSKGGATKPRNPKQTTLASMGRDLDRQRRERQQGAGVGVSTAQGNMTEDEALAHAIQLSMAESQNPKPSQAPQQSLTAQEQEDQQLAQALAASEQQAARERRRRQQQQQQQQREEKSCEVS